MLKPQAGQVARRSTSRPPGWDRGPSRHRAGGPAGGAHGNSRRGGARRRQEGRWRRLHVVFAWEAVEGLAAAWPLRDADLWHLAAARALQADLPELVLLTFDKRLREAAVGEGLTQA